MDERVTEGARLSELLRAELDGRTDGALGALTVAHLDPQERPVPGTRSGADGSEPDATPGFAVETSERRLAAATPADDRLVVSVSAAPDVALETAREAGLRVRPRATDPPATLVFVEDGAAVKAAVDVLVAVATADRE